MIELMKKHDLDLARQTRASRAAEIAANDKTNLVAANDTLPFRFKPLAISSLQSQMRLRLTQKHE